MRGVVLAVMLCGCATSYRGGISDTQLAENRWRVSFSGNGYTKPERAADFAMLRSAEVCKTSGFDFFALTSEESDVSQSAVATTSYVGNSAITNVNVVHKPSTTNTVLCLRERPAQARVEVYESEFVWQSLTKKYGIEQ